MAKGIFSLARESLEDGVEETSEVVTFEPEDVIAAEEDAAEVAELVAEVQEGNSEIEAADGAQVIVEEEIAREEELLEKPEEITATDVIVAQEKLELTARLMGTSLADLGITTVSHESIAKSPVTGLTVSLESAKDVALAIIENVKIVFKKILANIKKIYVKLVVLMARSGATADAMIKKLKDMKVADDAKFSPEQQASIAAKLAVPAALNGKKIPENPSVMIGEFLKATGSNEYTAKAEKEITALVKATDVLVESKGEKGEKEFSDAVNAVNELQMSGYVKDIAGLLAKGEDFTQKPSGDFFGPFKYDGAAIKAVAISIDKNKPTTTVGERVAATTQAVVTYKFKPDFLKSVTVEVPKKESLNVVLKQVKDAAGKIKPFADKNMAAINAADKAIDKLSSVVGKTSELGGASKSAVTFATKNARILATNIALDSILGYVGAVKAVLGYCSIATSVYTK